MGNKLSMYFNLTFVSQFLWEGMFVGETMHCAFVGETTHTPLCVCGENTHTPLCVCGENHAHSCCVFVGETMHTPLCFCGRKYAYFTVFVGETMYTPLCDCGEKTCTGGHQHTLRCVFVGETMHTPPCVCGRNMHCVLIVSMKQSSRFQQWPPACLIKACTPCLHMVPPTLKLFLSVSLMLLSH